MPQINVRPETTDPGISQDTKQDKEPKHLHRGLANSDCRKLMIKKVRKEDRRKKQLQKNKDKNYIQPLRNHASQEECNEISKGLREKNHQPRIPYLVKLIFKSEGEIKAFSNKS